MIRLLSLISIIFISSCGFTPVYKTTGEKTPAAAALNQIDIAIIPDRDGQYLRNALMDRFYTSGVPANPDYRLRINPIGETINDFDITIDSEATRRQLKLSSTMVLTDNKTSDVLLKRPLLAITSHNVLESEFSTIVTEQSAREAALNDLARQIERNLALYFAK